jgi:hypothetical protein
MSRGKNAGPPREPEADPNAALKLAVELSDREQERAVERQAVREAARELGVAEHHLAEAEETLTMRRAVLAGRAATRRRWFAGGLAALVLSGGGVVVWQATRPEVAPPWRLVVADQAAVTLDASPGTEARLALLPGPPAVAEVTVSNVTPQANGKWHVNLDRRDVPPLDGHTHLTVTLSGTLPTARVYLEAASDERWRSGPIALTEAPVDHPLALDTFDHQRRGPDGTWKTVDFAAPRGVHIVSVKLGHFVNAPTDRGWVRVGEVRAGVGP